MHGHFRLPSGEAGAMVLIAIITCLNGNRDLRASKDNVKEAPTGFNNSSNGFEDQESFDRDRKAFEEVETISGANNVGLSNEKRVRKHYHKHVSADQRGDEGEEAQRGGLGPVYNATSCVACHQNPVTGSSSQVSELRAGQHLRDATDAKKLTFVEPPGGSLIHHRAIDPQIQEHVRPEDQVRTLRMSTNILGNGFVEVIPDKEILLLRKAQPDEMRGLAVAVPVAVTGTRTGENEFEFEFALRLGRFGWKCQEASLINFSAGAYVNEMGITSPLQPKENTSGGRDVSQFDLVLDPEDDVDPEDPDNEEHPFGEDVKAFARFMRSTKAPPRDFTLAGNKEVQEGEKIFKTIGCGICHYPTYTTPPPNTVIASFELDAELPASDLKTVPPALGNKIIHPYSDFMLHDIGTGDGIAQTQHAQKPPRGAEPLLMRAKIAQRYPEAVGLVTPSAEIGHQPIAASSCLDQRTINMIRTAPLWGLRVRPQLMHDGLSLTIDQAIRRHQGQARNVRAKYEALPDKQKTQLILFLSSL